ncbi:translation initiation factor IF-2-like [Choloepus didactylus]|uniref:translation initiation factor IF-2-like n=1 Tax=Choloepus didactylus TaxID=27675 RepID=UPI00189F0972|nr:translation initiation factor IF-2-like [Choloepus didactylus]
MVPPSFCPGPPLSSGSADTSRYLWDERSPCSRPGPVCGRPGRADCQAGTRRSARPSGEEPGQGRAEARAEAHPRKGPTAPPREMARTGPTAGRSRPLGRVGAGTQGLRCAPAAGDLSEDAAEFRVQGPF